MFEGQRFEPEGRLAQFMRVVSDFERDEVEAAVDGLLAFLDRLDGDPDLEDGHDAEAITLPIGRQHTPPGDLALMLDDDEWSGDHQDASFPEWSEKRGRVEGAVHAYAGLTNHEDSEADGDELDGNVSEDDDMVHGGEGAGCPIADSDGDAAWPEGVEQPGHMFGGLAGEPGNEDAEPWFVPPVTAFAPINDNERRAA